jgi:hypothetical protein
MPDNKVIGYAILESYDTPSEAHVVSDGRRVMAEGILQEAEEENRNGRVYLVGDLLKEITCPRTIELLNAGYMRGEAGHPVGPGSESIVRQQTIEPGNVCVKFTKLWMDGNFVMGRFRGTNNSLGEAFDLDLRDGDKPAFSLRALGSLENIRGRNVVRDLKIITYDSVIYPSHPKAYTTRLVEEAANVARNKNSIITESAGRNSGSYPTKSILEQSVNKNGSLIPIMNEDVMSYIKTESANISSILGQIDCFYESAQLIGSQVRLVTKAGDVFMVNLESHVQDEIQSYCSKYLNKK